MKEKIKARLIHILGGYTKEEYEREARFILEPKIKGQNFRTATCFTQALIRKEEWDKGGGPATLETIKAFLRSRMADEITPYAEFFHPESSDPEFYTFAMKIEVVKPEHDQLP